MIAVKVTYTVKEGYSAENKEKIAAFLEEFKSLNNKDFIYTIFALNDDKTFVHLSQYRNEDVQRQLLNTPSFLVFQNQRDKNLESNPVIETMVFIGSSFSVFE